MEPGTCPERSPRRGHLTCSASRLDHLSFLTPSFFCSSFNKDRFSKSGHTPSHLAHTSWRILGSQSVPYLLSKLSGPREARREKSEDIEECNLNITSLDAQITALESESQNASAFFELRDLAHTTAAVLQFLVAPIRTLPVELLAEIFGLTIRVPTNIDSSESLHIQDAFRVSHVCRDWRQIAFGTPRLWAGPIVVEFQPASEETYADGLRAWFARSAPLPIGPISVKGLVQKHGIYFDISSRVTEELLKIAPRWLSLRLLERAPASFVKQLAEGSLDALEELALKKVNGSPGVDLTAIPFCTTAPRLRRMTMNVDCPIPMPWAKLADITLTEGQPPRALDILARCTNLARASVTSVGWDLPAQAKTDIIRLNHLHVLSLAFSGTGKHVMPFLDRISAPALDDLCLYFAYDASIGWPEAQFRAFQLRSPKITKLDITGAFPVSSALKDALLHAPLLTHLAFNDCWGINDDLFLALCYKDGVPPLVPCLHTLTLTLVGISAEIFSENILADMITSRWWTEVELASRPSPPAVARWRRIELAGDSDSQFSQNFIDVAETLQRAGLAVKVSPR